MQSWADWLDRRLDYRLIGNTLRNRFLPNGPSWFLTSGSCLFWLIVIECVTGMLLTATYSPSMTSAWASVHFIDKSWAGKFIRGFHHYNSHALIIVFVFHLLHGLMTRAYRAPREFLWFTGILLFPLVVVWCVTGNPLSASQKGMMQIQVEGGILGSTPVLGPFLRRVLFGGEEVGSLTLTRLYFLHVGVLPLLFSGLCAFYFYQLIKHDPFRAVEVEGASASPTALPYWPYQSVRNRIALSVLVAIIGWCSWKYGAPLYAPADPDLAFSPRPEWYFRWLFELRRYFSGDTEFIATMVVPTVLLGVFLAVPFLDYLMTNRINLVCRTLLVVACFSGWGVLTMLSFSEDWHDVKYRKEQEDFEKISQRVNDLAKTEPMSEKGAGEIIKNDPHTQGPKLFKTHCVSCHSHLDSHGEGLRPTEQSAPNLYGIGSLDWIAGFLEPERLVSDEYFGRTKFREGEMVDHVKGLFASCDQEALAHLKDKLRAVATALAAEAEKENSDSPLAMRGREYIISGLGCTDCHRFHKHGEIGSAPDLTGYGSASWLKLMISKPSDRQYYGDRNDRMPDFAANSEHPDLNKLAPQDLELLTEWLREPTSSVNPSKSGE